jgi:hypothetical protein
VLDLTHIVLSIVGVAGVDGLKMLSDLRMK